MAKGDWTIWVMIIAGVLVIGLIVGGIAYGVHKLHEKGVNFDENIMVDARRSE